MTTANPVQKQGSVLEDLERIKQESLETLEQSQQLSTNETPLTALEQLNEELKDGTEQGQRETKALKNLQATTLSNIERLHALKKPNSFPVASSTRTRDLSTTPLVIWAWLLLGLGLGAGITAVAMTLVGGRA